MDEMIQKVLDPFLFKALRSDLEHVRDLKKIFPKIRKSKEKVVTEVVKESKVQEIEVNIPKEEVQKNEDN